MTPTSERKTIGILFRQRAKSAFQPTVLAYIACPESTLWRSKADGSQRLQLTYRP